jgi:hypothetical protein
VDPKTSDSDFPNLRAAMPGLKIKYGPFDPDSLDPVVTAVLLETSGKNEELPMHVHRKGQLVVALKDR